MTAAAADTGWVGPAVIAAVIIGAANFALWFVSGWRERQHADILRRERVRDTQRALYAEIRAYRTVLERDDLEAYRDAMTARMREADAAGETFVPMIPVERNDTVFQALVPEIHILPKETVEPVVLYYHQVGVIRAMIEDLRSDDFAAMSVTRQIKFYEDYIAFKIEAARMAAYAMDRLAGDGDDA